MSYSMIFLIGVCVFVFLTLLVLTLLPEEWLNPQKGKPPPNRPNPALPESEVDFVFSDETDHMRDQLLGLARDAIYFPTVADPQDATASLSFFGGQPIGPGGFKWPQNNENGDFYAFIGQLNIADLPATNDTGTLPENGVLYVFLANRAENMCQVLYYPNPSDDWTEIVQPDDIEQDWDFELRKTGGVATVGRVLPKFYVAPTAGLHYPSIEDFGLEILLSRGGTPSQREAYKKLSQSLNETAIPQSITDQRKPYDYAHKMGGYPMHGQHDDGQNIIDHHLLLEIGSDSKQLWDFGRHDVYQIWIHHDDLKAHHWDKAFATCTH